MGKNKLEICPIQNEFTLTKFIKEEKTFNPYYSYKLPLSTKLKIFFSSHTYQNDEILDRILLSIIDNFDKIKKVTISHYNLIFDFFNEERIKFWNENRWYAWLKKYKIYKYDKSCHYTGINGNDNKYKLLYYVDEVSPSRNVMIKFAEFCYQLGVLIEVPEDKKIIRKFPE